MNRHPWRKRPDQLVIGGGAIRSEQGALLEEVTTGELDFFGTPTWCTRGLIEVAPPGQTVVLEPSAGDGAIVQELLDAGYEVRAIELRPRALPGLRDLCPSEWGDWLRFSSPGRGYPELVKLCGPLEDVAILGNPPFAVAQDFVAQALLTSSPWVCFLLRVNVIASRPWSEMFSSPRTGPGVRQAGTLTAPTAIANLRKRPSFSGDGKTSMDNYAWFIWEAGKAPIDFRPIG